MSLRKIILSDRPPVRYYRHIIFWSIVYIAISFAYILFSLNIAQAPFFFQLSKSFSIFIGLLYTYTIIYWLTPALWQRGFKSLFVALVIALTLISYLAIIIFNFSISNLSSAPRDVLLAEVWIITIQFVTIGPPNFLLLFLALKMFREYVMKTVEKSRLIEETKFAELTLLKAQIHPHFLFNTLNNIYSFNLNKSPVAAQLLLQLIDTLKYMLNECAAERVLLEKELKMISDYVGLEKVRYGERLKMEVKIEGDPGNKFIAPLLLIPFVENSFKHGTSKMLEHPWIRMKIEILDDQLYFELQNSKPNQSSAINGKNGIGLANARKRLSLLYPNNHTLDISSTADSFLVRLKLPLESGKTVEAQMNDRSPMAEPAV